MGRLPARHAWQAGKTSSRVFPLPAPSGSLATPLTGQCVGAGFPARGHVGPHTSLTLSGEDSPGRARAPSQGAGSRGVPLRPGQRPALGWGRSWERTWCRCQVVSCRDRLWAHLGHQWLQLISLEAPCPCSVGLGRSLRRSLEKGWKPPLHSARETPAGSLGEGRNRSLLILSWGTKKGSKTRPPIFH